MSDSVDHQEHHDSLKSDENSNYSVTKSSDSPHNDSSSSQTVDVKDKNLINETEGNKNEVRVSNDIRRVLTVNQTTEAMNALSKILKLINPFTPDP